MNNNMNTLIKNLTLQLETIKREHSIEVKTDTYWRGVMVGLENSLEMAKQLEMFHLNEVGTTNSFIRELQQISEEKRKLPLIVKTPNGMSVYPNVKMVLGGLNPSELSLVDTMAITWRD